ncbi:MAG: helix-turn-helix transcriptional regulator [Patescibacteria group bacterium]
MKRQKDAKGRVGRAGALDRAPKRGARRVICRIHRIHRALAGGACPGIEALAAELGVSSRTIERDLQQLRNFYAPLVFDRGRGGYRYAGPFSLPCMTLTAGELAVLLIGQRLLVELAGTPFVEPARQLIEKLPLVLGE